MRVWLSWDGYSTADCCRRSRCIRRSDRAAVSPISPQVGVDLGGDGRGGRAAASGDDLLDAADIVATRAIGIDAPASAIWPWLVQMGPAVRAPTPMTGSRTSSASTCTARTGSTRSGRTSRSGMSCAAATADPGCGWRSSPRTGALKSLRGRRLGLDLCPCPRGRLDPPDQSQPNRDEGSGGPAPGHARHGAWLARHGAEDAARDQAARRTVTPAALRRRRAPPPSRDSRYEAGRRAPSGPGRHRSSATRTSA